MRRKLFKFWISLHLWRFTGSWQSAWECAETCLELRKFNHVHGAFSNGIWLCVPVKPEVSE